MNFDLGKKSIELQKRKREKAEKENSNDKILRHIFRGTSFKGQEIDETIFKREREKESNEKLLRRTIFEAHLSKDKKLMRRFFET